MPQSKKEPVDLAFPLGGVVEGAPHGNQPPNTTWDAMNVMPFDVEEDRARGGRREGIEKVTGNPVSSERLQMVSSVGVVPGDATSMVAGQISSFSSDQSMDHKDGYIRYAGYEDGTKLSFTTLGHKFYGMCNKKLSSPNQGAPGPDTEFDMGLSQKFATNSVLPSSEVANPDYSMGLDCWKDAIANEHSGVTKQTDENGAPYISIKPSMFPVVNGNTSVYDGGQFWIDQADESDLADAHNQGGDEILIQGTMSLMPDSLEDEHTWDSSGNREFVTRFEFQFPKTHQPTEESGHAARPALTFVATAADADTDNEIYDPWYVQCFGGTLPSPSSEHKYYAYGSDDSTACGRQFGFLFRMGATFDDDPITSDEWLAVNSTNKQLAVFFQRNASAQVNSNVWHLMCGEIANTTSFRDHEYPSESNNFQSIKNIVLGDGEEELDPNAYHTLEIRNIKNAVDILFNGVVVRSYEDISDPFNNLTTLDTSRHGMFFDNCNHSVIRQNNGGDNDEVVKQVKYWATRDWTNRKDDDGDSAASNDSKYACSDELRVRSWQWYESGGHLSIPQNTLAVSGGYVYGSPGQSEFSRVSSSQDLDALQSPIMGVEYFRKFYFVDGKNYKVYDPTVSSVPGVAGSVSDWDASSGLGELPGGNGKTGVFGDGTSDGNPRASIIASWLGRIVLSGRSDDPQNWFMSAVGEPLNWQFGGGDDLTGAIKGSSTTRFGEMASAITALIPFSHTSLVVGGNSSLHLLTGDPLWDNSEQRALSLDVGIVGPQAWCYGPGHSMYFMSENGLYVLMPNDYDVSQTDRLSAGKFDKTFGSVDFQTMNTLLAYDHKNHGVHIFLTPRQLQVGVVKHYYYDRRSNSFWPMEYPGTIGPTVLYDFKSPDPGSRKILLGGFDGHIRTFSDTAKDDDGTAISSHVWIGPIQASSLREAKLIELVAVLDRESPGVNYEIYVSDTVEDAKKSTAVYSSTWSAGRNASRRLRARGAAIFVKIFDSSVDLPWVYERLTAVLAIAGRVRQR
jgi:hypothetical protein